MNEYSEPYSYFCFISPIKMLVYIRINFFHTCCPKFLNDEVLHLRCHESKRKLFLLPTKTKTKHCYLRSSYYEEAMEAI